MRHSSGYISITSRAHSCHYCYKDIKNNEPEYRMYYRSWSRGFHIFCAHKIMQNEIKKLKKIGTRRNVYSIN